MVKARWMVEAEEEVDGRRWAEEEELVEVVEVEDGFAMMGWRREWSDRQMDGRGSRLLISHHGNCGRSSHSSSHTTSNRLSTRSNNKRQRWRTWRRVIISGRGVGCFGCRKGQRRM